MSEKSNKRPITVTAVSICFLVFGLIWLIAMASGFFIGTVVSGLSIIGSVMSSVFSAFALICMLISAIDIAVGYGLLRMKRWAAILGMLLSLIGAVIERTLGMLFISPLYLGGYGTLNYMSLVFSAFSEASMWVNLMLFIAIAVSWKSFQIEMA
ncbi:hypothetical protein HXY33_08310 [Candidatus Bathyarchaeota archaeon]|nr:hypothetical protein [Candidatus Bathyarchaeota archaeon]